MGEANPQVAIIMGSQSDWPTMKHAADTLEALGVSHEARIVSAHRTPQRLYDFATGARDAGFKVVIAGAGGAAAAPLFLGLPCHRLPCSVVGHGPGAPVAAECPRASDQVRSSVAAHAAAVSRGRSMAASAA